MKTVGGKDVSGAAYDKSRKRLRSRILWLALSAIMRSRLALFVITCLLVFIFQFAVRKKPAFILLSLLRIVDASLVGFLVWYRKQLIFELLVVVNAVECNYFNRKEINLVDDLGIYLGPIPINEKQEYSIRSTLNIKAILTVNESYELETMTLIGRPIQPSVWASYKIEQLVIPSPDFVPPACKLLDQGANFIEKYISKKQNVYVHCKSGKGRSASMVCAYFIKYRNMTPLDAYLYLKKRRNGYIFNQNSAQFHNLVKYKEYVTYGKSS